MTVLPPLYGPVSEYLLSDQIKMQTPAFTFRRLPERSDPKIWSLVGLGTKYHCAGEGQQQFSGESVGQLTFPIMKEELGSVNMDPSCRCWHFSWYKHNFFVIPHSCFSGYRWLSDGIALRTQGKQFGNKFHGSEFRSNSTVITMEVEGNKRVLV
jgi:hypothetical protein